MGKTRLNSENPKIGIRPIIDGRRGGIRESLEDMTMNMAKRVADLYASSLRYSNGDPVECVIADTTIGGVAEAARVDEQLKKQGVGVILSVSPCWCYGFETINMDGDLPRAIWGFNGTERPGAVYLAAALAVHNQKGLPTFGIYGRDVQDVDSEEIPEDVKEKLLRFAKAGLAVATMRGKAYLSIGSVSMGIGGSIPNPDFFQDYLGMRNEYVDASEIERRIKLGIYDHEEFDKAMAWTEKYCKTNEGKDHNPKHLIYSREEKDAVWEYVVKMTMIFRDLMIGNPKLAEMGFKEESNGHYALVGGFQGQRQWTDFKPDGDFSETILNSSFDWNGIREAFTFATENDTLNGVSMLFNKLLSNRAQIFADVRTYWSPVAYERVTGQKLEGDAANGFIHLINSGSCTLDGSGRQTENGKPAMKPFWEIQEKEAE
ncbi:MAG: L-fucose isomerase, partial [Prevotella buccalis]|nr:L-fucose isomerase [Hoylesella buccalis]